MEAPGTTLFDFGGKPVNIAAKVMLRMSWKGSSVDVPVFIPRPGHVTHHCLLGTNVISPLGIVSFEQQASNSIVCSDDGEVNVPTESVSEPVLST